MPFVREDCSWEQPAVVCAASCGRGHRPVVGCAFRKAPEKGALMSGSDVKGKQPAVPFLFGKRVPVAAALADQYVGTDTELDIK